MEKKHYSKNRDKNQLQKETNSLLSGNQSIRGSYPLLSISDTPRLIPHCLSPNDTIDYLVISHYAAQLFFPLVDENYMVNQWTLDCPRETVWVISEELQGPTKAIGPRSVPFTMKFLLKTGEWKGQEGWTPLDRDVKGLKIFPVQSPEKIGYGDLLKEYGKISDDGSFFIEKFQEFLQQLVKILIPGDSKLNKWNYEPEFIAEIKSELSQRGFKDRNLIIMENIDVKFLSRVKQEWLEMQIEDWNGFGPLHIFKSAKDYKIGYYKGL